MPGRHRVLRQNQGHQALIWLVLGVAVLVWLRARRPEAVERIGSILGEEGGTDADALDA